MKRLKPIRTSILIASLLAASFNPVKSQKDLHSSFDKESQELIKLIKEKNPWLNEEFCMKKEIYESPITEIYGPDRWKACSTLLFFSKYDPLFRIFEVGADQNFIDYSKQKQFVKIMNNDALWAWYIATWSSFVHSSTNTHYKIDGLRMNKENRNSTRIVRCNRYKEFSYYVKENQSTSPLSEYCSYLLSKLVENSAIKGNKREDQIPMSSTDNKQNVHNQCKNAADYEGCMRYQGSK